MRLSGPAAWGGQTELADETVLRRAPTERDVAKLAGVSQSAVSRAFTPGASVAKDTRGKVLKAAEALGYKPNLLARSLATRRTNIVALAISNLENPFYVQVVKELSDRLHETNRQILLFITQPGADGDAMLERVLSFKVDALVLAAATASPALAAEFHKSGVPIVQINRPSGLSGISTVCGENELAGERIASFLIAGGHRRFGYVSGTVESSIGKARLDGFSKRLKGHAEGGIQVAYGDYTFEGAAEAARKLLTSARPPDAIFCASDYMAFAVLDVARRELGLDVPADVSVVGFDDVPEASHPKNNLTTYSQPASALVVETIRILDAMIEKPGRPARRREVHGDLIVRGSARLPARGIVTEDTQRIWRE